MVGEYPRHRHLYGELDPLPHSHLQIELSVPQLDKYIDRYIKYGSSSPLSSPDRTLGTTTR